MAETDTTTQSPDDIFAQAQAIADRMRGQQQSYAPPAPANRSIISLLGEAVGGGASDVAPADREAAGTRALLNFGANLSAASGPSVMPRNFGQILAQGVSGAEQSLGSSAAVSASRLAAQQAYEEKQQELTISRIKEAIPLLTLQTQMQQAAAARGIASGQRPSTSIAAAGAPPAEAPLGAYGAGGPNDAEVPKEYLPYYQEASARTGIPVDVLIAQHRQESGFNAGAVGKAGEIGIGQIKSSTAAAPGGGVQPVDPATLKDPRANINFAADYLKSRLPPGADPKDPTALRVALARYNGGGDPNYVANVTRYLPVPAPQQAAGAAPPGAPYKVASAGTTVPVPAPGAPAAPPAPGSVAAETAGLVVPPGATPQPPAPASAIPAAPQYPDVTSGDVTVRHPGPFVDFAAKEMAPVPQTEDFNPNLSQQKQAEFTAKAKGLADQQRLLDSGAVPFADQPKVAADLLAARAALEAEQSKEADAKAQAAATNTTKFNDTQREAVQKRYDAAVAAYTEAAKSKFSFHQDIIKSQAEKQVAGNDEMLKPYEIAATQAGQVLPIISLAKQVLPELPTNASPWLADERNRARLESLAPFLPAGWTKATDGADLFAQVMSNIVVQMGANVQSGQTGGREAAYQEFRSMLPTLSQSAEGRERALMFMQEIAQRRLQEAEFLQSYRSDPANRDPTLGVPNMGAARSAMETALPPMLKLPPLRYNPNLPATDPKEAANQVMYRRYFASVPDGGRYIGYGRDEQGAAHPVARTKVKGQPPQIGLE